MCRPNELELEKPYIQQNITLTRQAYNLQQDRTRAFPVEQGLTLASLQANQATIDNIRLWDEQPLMATFGQLQEIRTYYKFRDVDVDRYWLDGSLSAGDAVGARTQVRAPSAECSDLGQSPCACSRTVTE